LSAIMYLSQSKLYQNVYVAIKYYQVITADFLQPMINYV